MRVPSLTLLFPEPCRPYLVLTAAVMVHLTLGTLYCIGNLVPYMASYLRFVKGQDVLIGQMSWFGSLTAAGQGAFMFVGGLIETRVGPRAAVSVGCALVITGVATTCFALQNGVAAAYVTYGVVFGAGIGIAYAPCISCAMRWLPKRRGLVSGCVVAGFGLGAFVFNYVATWFVNPGNLVPRVDVAGVKYFDQPDVLDKTPTVFLILAVCYAAIQLVALCFIVDPPEDYAHLDDLTMDITGPTGMKPLEMLKTQTFYFIWSTFLLVAIAVNFVGSYYKVFGEIFIDDDHFLSLTGSIASICNAFGRIFWGFLGDKFSYQSIMSIVAAQLAFLFFTLQLTSRGGKPMFMIWVLAIYFTFSGIFALLPMVTANVFGRLHFATNYGIVFTGAMTASLLSAAISTLLLQALNFYGIFFIMSGCACVALVLTMTINLTDHGKRPLQ